MAGFSYAVLEKSIDNSTQCNPVMLKPNDFFDVCFVGVQALYLTQKSIKEIIRLKTRFNIG